jgi:hypothetical protein
MNAFTASSSPARAAAYSRDGGGSRSPVSGLLSGVPNLTAGVGVTRNAMRIQRASTA